MSTNGLMASSTPPSSNSGPKASGNSLCKNYEQQQSHMNINKGCSGGTTHGTTSVNSSKRDTSTPPDSSSNSAEVQNQAQAHPTSDDTTTTTTPNDTTTNTHTTATTSTNAPTHNTTTTTTTTPTPNDDTQYDTQNTHGTEPYTDSNTESSRNNDSSGNNDQYRYRHDSGRRSSSYRSKDSSFNSNSTADSSSSNTSQNSDMLNFAKRDIAKHCGRASYSQLSSLTQNSPEHIIEPVSSVSEEPVYQADDHVRITNPASAALSRMPEAEQIGFHEPFGNNPRANSRSGSSSSSGQSPKTGIHRDGSGGSGSSSSGSNPNTVSSDGSANPTTNSAGEEAAGLLSSRTSPITLQPYVPKRKPYEPARVVLHKSELNAPYGSSNNGGSGGSDSNSDISSTLNNSQSSVSLSGRNGSTLSLNGLRNGSVSDIVPQYLVRSLAGSPEGPSINGPIKHIREPKQPIYIPAVLRPTEEASYDLGSPQGNTSQGSISSSSTLPGSAAVLHSQKPVTRHWVPDQKAKKCNSCDRDFTWYRRRHHCRKCGGVFCADDANRTIGLDRVLNYNVLGVPCKSCDKCASEFAAFCHDSPRLSDNTLAMQQPLAGPETEELDVGSGGDWSTF